MEYRNFGYTGVNVFIAAKERFKMGDGPNDIGASLKVSCGHTLHDLAFTWLLSHKPVPSAIAGVTRPDQIAENAAATGWTLTPDELTELQAMF